MANPGLVVVLQAVRTAVCRDTHRDGGIINCPSSAGMCATLHTSTMARPETRQNNYTCRDILDRVSPEKKGGRVRQCDLGKHGQILGYQDVPTPFRSRLSSPSLFHPTFFAKWVEFSWHSSVRSFFSYFSSAVCPFMLPDTMMVTPFIITNTPMTTPPGDISPSGRMELRIVPAMLLSTTQPRWLRRLSPCSGS